MEEGTLYLEFWQYLVMCDQLVNSFACLRLELYLYFQEYRMLAASSTRNVGRWYTVVVVENTESHSRHAMVAS